MSITTPLPIEASIAAQVREKTLQFIDAKGMDAAAFAAEIDADPQTAQLLLARERWDMHLALTIAEQLGIDVTVV